MTDVIKKEEVQLLLETSKRKPIKNYQQKEISKYELSLIVGLENEYGNKIWKRSEPSPTYNCHGMTFAARRTGIFDSIEIEKILKDDDYVEITRDEILPGDIIIYYGEDGDPEHSGIVITPPDPNLLNIPKVCSKWGKYSEVIHYANNCPYSFSNVKYYRALT